MRLWPPQYFCSSDIPRINPGTGFPSGPRMPCRAPGTVKRRRVLVLQRAIHIKGLQRWSSAFGCRLPVRYFSPSPPERVRNSLSCLVLLQVPRSIPSKDINTLLQKQTRSKGVVTHVHWVERSPDAFSSDSHTSTSHAVYEADIRAGCYDFKGKFWYFSS